jgi:hypothetical protein
MLGRNPSSDIAPAPPYAAARRDCTDIDMMLGDLLIEAKLTEYDFQTAPRKLIERYRDIEAVFDIDELEILDGTVQSYQLIIRGVVAAHASPGRRFCGVWPATLRNHWGS